MGNVSCIYSHMSSVAQQKVTCFILSSLRREYAQMMFKEHMADRNKWNEGCVWLVTVFLSEWVYKGYLVLKQQGFVPRLDKKH